MRLDNGRIAGILGAIIIHLVAGIIFMIVKIGELNIRDISQEYEIALEDKSEPVKQDISQQQRIYSIEQVLRGDDEMLNIARNLANAPDVRIDREDYIDMVKNELIEQGKLGTDNYIDGQKRKRETAGEDISTDGRNESEEEEKPKDSQEMASKYSGPTRIYYNLPGRTHTYLPIPIYKCEGAGKVVLAIEVNPKGTVIKAEVLVQGSDTKDQCLIETAINTALVSRFNPDAGALKNQAGTLTYHFVAQ